MCGIAGIIGDSAPVAGVVVRSMVDVIRYRSPDDSGVQSDPALVLATGYAGSPPSISPHRGINGCVDLRTGNSFSQW